MTRRGTRSERHSGGATAVQFTEEMKGHAAFGEEDHLRGQAMGREAGTELRFRLTIVVDPVDRFVRESRHEAVARGHVHCEELGGTLPVERGVFNLFVEEGDPGLRRMLYRLHFRDVVGHPLTLVGYKTVRRRHLPPFDVWPDTTTLYTRVLRGFVNDVDAPEAEIVASGVLRIHVLDFGRQLLSFRTQGPSRRMRVGGLGRFAGLFVGQLWDVYVARRGRAAAGT